MANGTTILLSPTSIHVKSTSIDHEIMRCKVDPITVLPKGKGKGEIDVVSLQARFSNNKG
jgi:hypothetical protein